MLFLLWDFDTLATERWDLCTLLHLGGLVTSAEVTAYEAALKNVIQLLPGSLVRLALETQPPQ